MVEKILTLHPAGKQGVNIDLVKYQLIREAIISALTENTFLSFQDLMQVLKVRLDGKFDGSIPWYTTTVKLDLEARKIIEKIPGSSPQILRLTSYKNSNSNP